MLIPAAIIGVIVFLYGCATVDDNIPRYAGHIYVFIYYCLYCKCQLDMIPILSNTHYICITNGVNKFHIFMS